MQDTIKKLNEGLEDPEYRIGWVANIAMAQLDCERWYREENGKVGKYLNSKDRHAIANKGAEYFLKLLRESNDNTSTSALPISDVVGQTNCSLCPNCESPNITDRIFKKECLMCGQKFKAS
jgi:hypothetical protein